MESLTQRSAQDASPLPLEGRFLVCDQHKAAGHCIWSLSFMHRCLYTTQYAQDDYQSKFSPAAVYVLDISAREKRSPLLHETKTNMMYRSHSC